MADEFLGFVGLFSLLLYSQASFNDGKSSEKCIVRRFQILPLCDHHSDARTQVVQPTARLGCAVPPAAPSYLPVQHVTI